MIRFFKRPPDRVIGEGYLARWYVIPRNRILNIYLHKFTGSDDDRALHDHPWHSVSFLLAGRLDEISRGRVGSLEIHHRREAPRFWPVFRKATHAHRLELIEGPAWTIFITGPNFRSWGFICQQGWRHWREFTDPSGNRVGRGCE